MASFVGKRWWEYLYLFSISRKMCVNMCKDGSLIVVCSVWRQISKILPISKDGWENSFLWKQLISTQSTISSETHNQMLLTLYQLCKPKGGKWRAIHASTSKHRLTKPLHSQTEWRADAVMHCTNPCNHQTLLTAVTWATTKYCRRQSTWTPHLQSDGFPWPTNPKIELKSIWFH